MAVPAADDDDDDDDDQTPVPLLLRRIEDIMHHLIDRLEVGRDLELSLDNGHTQMKKRRTLRRLSQARSVTNIILVLAYCHALYPRVATTREVYYYYVTHFKSQRECDAAIADACAVLGGQCRGRRPWPRHRLGLHASSRGWYAGPMTTTAPTTPPTTTPVGTTAAAAAALPPPDQQQHPWAPRPITADWLRHFPLPIYYESSATPRCMLLVEKEGIFQRLLDDGGIAGCIIVTGKGFPDLATRALVWTVHRQWPDLPIYGLADCDPYGVSVLDCYNTPPVVDDDDNVDDDDDDEPKNGDDDEATTSTTTIIIPTTTTRKKKRNRRMVAGQLPIQWLGLRPSQHAHLNFPDAVFQELTSRDRRRLETLLSLSETKEEAVEEEDGDHVSGSSFCDRSPLVHAGGATAREEELGAMATTKVELEALHWLGMGFCSAFVTRLIEHNLQQNNYENAVAMAETNNKGGEKNDKNKGIDNVDDDDAAWMLAI